MIRLRLTVLCIIALSFLTLSCDEPGGDGRKPGQTEVPPESLGKGNLRFVKAWISTENLGTIKMPFMKVLVRNVGPGPVMLGMYVPQEKAHPELVRQRRRSSALFLPYRLGLEHRYRSESLWRWTGSHRWIAKRRKGDRPTATPPRALIQPGETREFAVDIGGIGGHKTRAWRGVLRDPAEGVIDEITVEPWSKPAEVERPDAAGAKPDPGPEGGDLSKGRRGTLSAYIMSNKGMSISTKNRIVMLTGLPIETKSRVWLSNGTNCPVKIEDGSTKVKINVHGRSVWTDYKANSTNPAGDVQVDILRWPDREPYGKTLNLGTKPPTGFRRFLYTDGSHLGYSDTSRPHVPPGRYRVVGSLQLQIEETQDIPTNPSTSPSGRDKQKVLEFALKKGYWESKSGIDKHGPYEIIGISAKLASLPGGGSGPMTGLRLRKRYTYTSVQWTDTLVGSGEKDWATLVMLDDPHAARDLYRKKPRDRKPAPTPDQKVWDSMVGRAGNAAASFALEKGIVAAGVRNAVASQGAAGIIVTAATNPEELFTVKFLAEQAFEIGVSKYAAALKLPPPHGTVIAFAALVVADTIVLRAQDDVVRKFSHSDDLLAEGRYDESSGVLAVTLENYGSPIYNVHLRNKAKGKPARRRAGRRGLGGSTDVDNGGKTVLSVFTPKGREADFELVYTTKPYPGHSYEHARDLTDLIKTPVPVNPASEREHASPLTITFLRAGDGGRGGPFGNAPMIKVTARVLNTSDETVHLNIKNAVTGRRFSSLEELEFNRKEGRVIPFGLGLEGRYNTDQVWHPYVYASGAWATVGPGGKPAASESNVAIEAGQRRSFSIMIRKPYASPVVRAYILTPDFIRIDERLLSLHGWAE